MEPTQQQFTTVPSAGTTITQPALPKIGKWKASIETAKAGWALLMKDTEVLLFPVLSLVTMSIVLALGFVAYVFVAYNGDFSALAAENGQQTASPATSYAVLFLTYVVSFFVTIFFQSGVVAIVNARLEGKDFSFNDGLNVALAHVGKIFVWSVVAATVGVLLRMLADRSKWLGKLVSMILGAAWGIVTFFIVPVLVLEEGGIGDSMKSSGETVRRTWGESLIVNFGAGLVFTLLAFGGILLFIASLFLGAITSVWIMLLGVIALVVYIVILTVVSSTLDVIFRVVLYRYAKNGTIAPGFPPELVQGALGKK